MSFNNMMMHQQLYQQQQQQQQQQPQLYSGQWTKEEQDFVTALVLGFKEGSLNIPDGTSLRFYIAAKLGCKPKRVSKKYERTGYNGKHVFRKDDSISEKDLQKKSDSLQQLERVFRESRSLVQSMHEAKGDNGARQQQVPIPFPAGFVGISTGGLDNMAALQSMDQRLAAIRSQIDRSSAALSLGGSLGGGYMPPTNPGFSGLTSRPRSEMLQAMMRSNHGLSGLPQYNPVVGLGGSLSLAGTGTENLLQELYHRRQQLLLNNLVIAPTTAAHMALPVNPGAMSTMSTQSPANKRSFDALGGGANVASPTTEHDSNEPDTKRAKAA